jgi:hypothetical protein
MSEYGQAVQSSANQWMLHQGPLSGGTGRDILGLMTARQKATSPTELNPQTTKLAWRMSPRDVFFRGVLSENHIRT